MTKPLKFLFIICIALITSCSQEDDKVLSGYIEGENTYVSTGITGTLVDLKVQRGQIVKKNDLLFTLDPEPDKSAMEAAQANVEELEAEVELAKVQLGRFKKLYTKNATDKSTLDQKQTDHEAKQKRLAAAKEQLAEAKWAFHQKTVYAPVSGIIFDTFYRKGEKVIANQPALAILAPQNIKVLFFIPEQQLSSIKIGQTIYFNCDGCKEATKAKITYISPEAEYTPPIIYAEKTRYKLVFLARARLPLETALNFRPGQPLEVYLNEP